jgi:hypothetical protein
VRDYAFIGDFDAKPLLFQLLNDFNEWHIGFSIGDKYGMNDPKDERMGGFYLIKLCSRKCIAPSRPSGMKHEWRTVIFSKL